MLKYFPFLQGLSSYTKSNFLKDLVAGLTVGVILIPQGMAYAMIAGLPPVYGLYASIFPLLVYMFLGTSKNVAIGPVAMDSLLVAVGLGTLAITGIENYIAMAIFLAFVVGLIQLILGVCRMGFLVNFLSKPVISGFTSAAAIIIIFSQWKHLLGAEIPGSNRFYQLVLNVVTHISETNIYDFIIGLSGIIILVVLKKWSKKIPVILVLVVTAILAVYFLNLEEHGVKIVGAIPKGLPHFKVPNIDIEKAINIWPTALTLALVGYLEAISIGKALQEKDAVETIDANKELVALGTSNIVGSFFQSYPITASFSRSAINSESGVRTNLAAIFTVIMVVLTLLFLTPLFYFLPNAILASIIMVSVFSLINFSYSKTLWNNQRDEFGVLFVTFLATLFISIPVGILLGVLFSLLLLVYRTSKPHFAVLGNIKGSEYYKNVNRFGDQVVVRDDLLIVRFDAQLYFGNASFFRKELFKQLEIKGAKVEGVIVNAEAINYIDSTAAQMLVKVIKELQISGTKFFIVGAIGPTRDIIFSSGIIDALGNDFLFVKTTEAVAYFDNPKKVSLLQGKVANQNRTNDS